jgi:hypothetical protein
MNSSEFKELLIRSLDRESDPVKASAKLEEAGVSFKFREGFHNKVMDKIYRAGSSVVREVEFVKNLNYVFYRIALPGVAAIILLLISIFLMEGSVSINSFLGLGNGNDESIICLLTGN